MFNLLPPNEKQNILKEYAYRKLILLCLFLAALGLIGVTSLLPSYLLSRARIAELSSDVARSKGVVQAEELQNQIKIVSLANSKIQLLVDVIDHMSARDVFKSVIDKRGNGVRISGMMYKRGGKDSGVIHVTGIARDRESLSSFVQTLKGDPLFNKVDLPVSNFAKDRNTQFTIQLSGKF